MPNPGPHESHTTPPRKDPPLSQRRLRLRSFLARRAAWAVGAACLLIAFERLWPGMLQTESAWLSVVSYAAFLLRTFEFHLALGATAVGFSALLLGARRAAAVSLVAAVVVFIPTATSYFPRLAPRPSRAGAALATSSAQPSVAPRPLRVMSVNLLVGVTRFERIIAEIRRIDPDVVCFVEYNPAAHEALLREFGRDYPHRVWALERGAYGQAVYSRREFVEARGRTREQAGTAEEWAAAIDTGTRFRGPQIRVVVEDAEGPVAVRCVHLTSPSSPRLAADLRREIPRLVSLIEQDRVIWPVVVAGDFNSTPNSAQHAALREAGLSESSLALGLGRATTWPRITPLRWFPNIRLDHVMATGVLRFEVGGVTGDFGSDHRGVWADLRRR
jgi:endonuclease/exonuclease/phosphatase (EEP) superfamily protein YafD